MVELSQIKDPADIRGLSREECEELADDIRTKIIQTVSQNGGHLSSNLGVVEITLALHRVFDTPTDKILFDVGHQAYAHKLITGRYEAFDTLRTYGGLSGFPRRCESVYDCFEAGHASTAISAALGFARARRAGREAPCGGRGGGRCADGRHVLRGAQRLRQFQNPPDSGAQ